MGTENFDGDGNARHTDERTNELTKSFGYLNKIRMKFKIKFLQCLYLCLLCPSHGGDTIGQTNIMLSWAVTILFQIG